MPILVDKSSPTRVTGLQKLVLSLAKAGYTHQQIADRMGTSRQAVSQTVRRAQAAVQAFRAAVQDFIAA